MSQFADIRVEWRVADIERTLSRKVDDNEISTLRSQLDRMEHSLREVRADIVWLRSELQGCQEQISRLEREIE